MSRFAERRYQRRVALAMVLYVVMLLLAWPLVRSTVSQPLRIVLALLPLLPVPLAIRAMVRVLRDQDELERRIDLESFAIAAMITEFGFFSSGLLLLADVGWQLRGGAVAIWVLPCPFASFGIARLLVSRCYRNHA